MNVLQILTLTTVHPPYAQLLAKDAQIEQREAEDRNEFQRLHKLKLNGARLDDLESNIASILGGENISDTADIDSALAKAQASVAACVEARRRLGIELAKEKHVAGRKVCDAIEAEYKARATRRAEALAIAFEEHAALTAIENRLIGQGGGLYGPVVGANRPDFLGSPYDKTSDLALFLREAHRVGQLKRLPEGVR
jgi:hypothetical protein